MAKKQTTPSITISDCIKELELINENVFNLKQATKMLVETIERGGSNNDLKKVITVFDLHTVIKNLSHNLDNLK